MADVEIVISESPHVTVLINYVAEELPSAWSPGERESWEIVGVLMYGIRLSIAEERRIIKLMELDHDMEDKLKVAIAEGRAEADFDNIDDGLYGNNMARKGVL